ncbi:MAG TPA: prolyl oligopeptidase family serine peptidase [Chloroflexia bacterium]|nr:prolyl oligopeptidase family serine peptidase [Chloroflexia bacterium]
MIRIESLLAARLFVAPQLVGDRLFFLSNLSGHLSLYAMDYGGSVPEPLLPPHIALQNPELIEGYVFYVFPALGQILVMVDHHGDERYQPMRIPLAGGIPEPAFGEQFAQERVHCLHCHPERNIVYFHSESEKEAINTGYRADFASGTVETLGSSTWGSFTAGTNASHTRAVLLDGYTMGDLSAREVVVGEAGLRPLYGTPLEDRTPDETVPLTGLGACYYMPADTGLLWQTTLFEDTGGLGYQPLTGSATMEPVAVTGIVHEGAGELVRLTDLEGDRYTVEYNIDGVSWLYEGRFDEARRAMHYEHVICGTGELANGVLEAVTYDRASDRFALSFCTATSPTQIYTVEGADRARVVCHTRERVLGIPAEWLAPGEDASFTSFDGLRISARLYLPAAPLGFEGPRPLVYYIHGGPQGQERPNFAWFSMPLIQFLTLNGFAVFVPNVRGSTGYGLAYTKRVDRDWGGQDRLDHVHALGVLARDARLDTKRAGVIGRSYGGYMTLTLATRHPELWAAAVDMFGPYELHKFMDRVPETWKPYFAIAVGDPVKDHDMLVERSPSTHIDAITCPLLVIQGQNDPRVVEPESRALVEHLRAGGKETDYIVFPDEGHDVLKFANRVRCYNAITEFFAAHLHP